MQVKNLNLGSVQPKYQPKYFYSSKKMVFANIYFYGRNYIFRTHSRPPTSTHGTYTAAIFHSQNVFTRPVFWKSAGATATRLNPCLTWVLSLLTFQTWWSSFDIPIAYRTQVFPSRISRNKPVLLSLLYRVHTHYFKTNMTKENDIYLLSTEIFLLQFQPKSRTKSNTHLTYFDQYI
jgi:hypothetical protein